jgi:hypothetical protein
MAERLITIAQYGDSIEANLAKQTLADFGIQSVIDGEYAGNVYALPNIRLQVLESEAQQAIEILESAKKIVDHELQQLEEEKDEFEGEEGSLDDFDDNGKTEEPNS